LGHNSQFDHIFSRRRQEKILVKLTQGPQNDSLGHINSVVFFKIVKTIYITDFVTRGRHFGAQESV
jgi:hypothetical protein